MALPDFSDPNVVAEINRRNRERQGERQGRSQAQQDAAVDLARREVEFTNELFDLAKNYGVMPKTLKKLKSLAFIQTDADGSAPYVAYVDFSRTGHRGGGVTQSVQMLEPYALARGIIHDIREMQRSGPPVNLTAQGEYQPERGAESAIPVEPMDHRPPEAGFTDAAADLARRDAEYQQLVARSGVKDPKGFDGGPPGPQDEPGTG